LQLPFKSSVELSSSVSFFDRSRILDALDPGRPDQKRGGSESASDLRITMQNNYFDKHELVLGAQIKRLDSRSQRHYFSADPDQHRQNVDGDWREYSLFIEDKYKIGDRTTLLGGLRYDVADFDDEFEFDGNNRAPIRFLPPDASNYSIRLALLHKGANSLVYRAAYQEGFAYPTVSEYPLIFAANAFLESQGVAPIQNRPPETLKSLELGVKGELLTDRLSFDLTAYYNRYEKRGRFVALARSPSILPTELISELPRGVVGVVLGLENDVDGWGAEAVLNWQPDERWLLNFSYGYAVPDGVDPLENQLADLTNEAGSQWSRFPKHQLRANGGFSNGKWRVSAAGLYQSGLEADDRNAPDRENVGDDYARVNLSLSYSFNPRTTFSLAVSNAFKNNAPNITVDTSRPWEGALGSDERLVYATLRIR